jgi:hypothetical protein
MPKVDPKDKQQVIAAIDKLTKRLRFEQKAQKKLWAKIRRNKAQIQKIKAWRLRRKRQLAKLNKTGQRRVVEEALRHVGKTESPAGSNRGPHPISTCQEHILGFDGVAWCGCFAGWLAEVYADVGAIGVRVAYCPYIEEDARLARNGFKGKVDMYQGEPGDFAVFDYEHNGIEDHVEVIIRNLGGGSYQTVGGNTSFDEAGSQSNGGCVALRERHISLFACIARPDYQ